MLGTAKHEMQRLRRITGVIGKYGYDEFFKRTKDLPEGLSPDDFVPKNGDRSIPAKVSGPRRFRQMLEELGPTFIKFGQVLSSRPDLVSRPYVEELKSLMDNCEPIPFASIEKAIREGLRTDPSDLFERIDPKPLATASIAQVHRGTTADGDEVVIKVQRPGIAEQIRADVDILYRIARFLDAVIEESQMAEPVGIVREFDHALVEELNFQVEAANLREFGKLHEHRSDVVVPVVYADLSSLTVLTMSFVDGVPLTRLPPEADKKAIAARMVKEAFDEVFIDGVFHADPHKGNLMFISEGKYGILDLGLLGRLSLSMRETLVVLALAIAMRDADTAARTIYRLGVNDARVDLTAVRNDTQSLFDRYLDREIQEVDSTVVLQELLSLAMKHRVRIPPEYTMLARAGATLEGIVREYHPQIDVAAVAKPYAEKLLMGRVAPENMSGGLYKAMLQFQGMSQDVPLQLSQILSDLSSNNFSVKVSGKQLERLNTTILMAATTLVGAILGGACVIGAFIGLAKLDWTLFGIPVGGFFGFITGFLIFGWLSAYVIFRPRMRKVSLMRFLFRRRPDR